MFNFLTKNKFIKNLFSPVLSDITIKKYIDKGELIINSPLNEEQFKPNSVNLTLDDSAKVLKHSYYYNYQQHANRIINRVDNYIDIRYPIKYDKKEFNVYETADGKSLKCYLLEPKEFVLMSTKETLKIPNGIVAFIQGRSSVARLGIQVEQSGLVDSGFTGTITLEMFNESSEKIMLFEGMRIAEVYFFKSQYAEKLYDTLKPKYQNQQGPTESRIYKDFK